MQFCQDPFIRFDRGEMEGIDKVKQRVLRPQVACGRCKACVSNRKQDWTGKLLAEGETAGASVFVTLTYKNEPDHFPYEDVQGMLKRLREYLWRTKRCGVRYFCVAERGDLHGRRHWHLILFLSRAITLRRTTPGRLWTPALQEGKAKDDGRLPFWPHGWASLEMLDDIGRRAQKMRYCVMYALKGIGLNVGERARSSLRDALGTEYIRQQAVKWADRGLAPNGKYNIPGVRWTKGHKAGQLQAFTLMGANRRSFIRAYRDRWEQVHPGRDIPVNDWLLQWDDDAVDPVHGPAAIRAVARAASGIVLRGDTPLRERPALDPSGRVQRRVIVGDDWAGEVVVMPGGVALVECDGRSWQFESSVSEVLDLDDASVIRIDKWVCDQRGPDYRPRGSVDECERQAETEKAARRAALSVHTAATIQRLRDRHGTSSGVGGVFGRPYKPQSRDPFWDRSKGAFSAPERIPRPCDITCPSCGVPHARTGSCQEGCDTEQALRLAGLYGQAAAPF